MSSYKEYEAFKEQRAAAIEKIEATKYLEVGEDSIGDYTSCCKSLDGFVDSAFRVGNSNSFYVIVNEFIQTINEIKEQANAYLSAANACKMAITSHMGTDNNAITMGDNAAINIMNNAKANGYKCWVTENGQSKEVQKDAAYFNGVANDEKERIWRAHNCSDLWED